MQKVFRRTLLAEKQAARRLAKRKDRNTREWAKSTREQVNFSRRQETSDIKAARHNRREDYELGPLAPRRDVGDVKETYGTLSGQRIRGQEIDYRKIEAVLGPVGYDKKWKIVNFVVGDRVVLLEGRDKGKIGLISALDVPRGECSVEGLNMADVEVPKWMLSGEDADKRPVRSMEKPVPLTSVLLVHPLKVKGKDEPQDVIIKKLVRDRTWKDELTGRVLFTRHIEGYRHINIPLPEAEPEEAKDYPSDTLRVDVEVKTFVPTLLRPPIPSSVIDELRNKFSIFRTRHDPEYIAAKLEEDKEKEVKKQQIKEMRTPLKEIHRLERKLKRKKGKGQLTDTMLERIGELIAKKRQLTQGNPVSVPKEEESPAVITA